MSVLIFTLMGCFLAANQCIVANVTEALGGTETEMGYMISALYIGAMVAVPLEGELSVLLGKRKIVFLATCLVCLGSLMIMMAQSVVFAIVGFAVYGSGIGGYEGINMALVADNRQHDSNRFLNLLQALFSIGAMVTPLLIATFLKSDEFRPLYAILVACYVFIALYFLTDRRIDTFASVDVREEGGPAFLKLMKNRTMLLYMAAMFIYLGAETALTFWVGSMYSHAGIGEYGAMALSVYWFASIIGRLLGTRVKSPKTIMAPCFLISAIGYFIVAFVPGVLAKTAAIVLVGIVFAPVYAGLALMGGELFPDGSAPAFTLMIFAANVGGVAFQPFISLFLSSADPSPAYWVTGILCGVVGAVLALVIARQKKAAVVV